MEQPRRLGDRYELGSLLGRGGMAEVYSGHDTRLGRTVAVKTLRADLARDPSFQTRFRREAQSAAALNHPLIVAVYDTGEDLIDGLPVPYIVMEYVEGSTLRELLRSGRKLLPERALEITSGVLQALEYSHHNGIVHRDIKPANVMLTRSGAVKVMDFGIARAIADSAATMTQTAAVIGTAQYLSPEQARGEAVDARSDLYSTGCLLYELLVDRPPFVGDSPVSVAYQHVREDPQPPSAVDPDVPPYADAIVLKALTKNPDNRYQNAEEMRADVEQALAGRPVAAPPVDDARAAAPTSLLPRGTSAASGLDDAPRRGRKASYALLALALLAVLAGGAFLGRALLASNDQVAVPGLVGKNEAQAETELTNVGLQLGARTPVASTEPEGTIIRQEPGEGDLVAGGTRIDVEVSTGPTTVPKLVGETQEDAEKALEAAELSVGQISTENSDEYEAGQVIRSDPAVNIRVARDTRVNLVISEGKPQATVPDVRGQTRDQAEQTLTSTGFKVEVSQDDETNPVAAPGAVVRQDPTGGEKADEGSTVTIFVMPEQPDFPPGLGQFPGNDDGPDVFPSGNSSPGQ